MKILSYNVNGIRAALKKNFASWLQEVTPDVVCLQETKAEEKQVKLSDELQEMFLKVKNINDRNINNTHFGQGFHGI